MHKDHRVATRENKVRPTRKVTFMQAIPITERMDEATNHEFGLRILGANARHSLASSRSRKRVSHGKEDIIY
jgi:hypothetical protein